MKEPLSYGSVKFKKVEAALDQIRQHYTDSPERLEDVNITFEYLIGSFFPKIMENINKQFNQQYTLGYIAGLQDKHSEETSILEQDNVD